MKGKFSFLDPDVDLYNCTYLICWIAEVKGGSSSYFNYTIVSDPGRRREEGYFFAGKGI